MSASFSSQSVLTYLGQQESLYSLGFAIYPIFGSPNSRLEERFVLFQKGTFVLETASSTESYSESFLILEGECEFIELGGSQESIKVRNLESLGGHSNIYISPKSNSSFMLIVKSDVALFFHAAYSDFTSKFKKVRNEYLSTLVNAQNILEQTSKKSIMNESEKVFRRVSSAGVLSWSDLDLLKEHLQKRLLDRARICAHNGDKSLLQEMFIVFDQSNFVTPAFHPDKDESILVLEGSIEIVEFDKLGNQESRVQLESWGNIAGKSSFFRVRNGVIHTLLVRSEYALLKETTSGPFGSGGTTIPGWAHRVVKGDLIELPFAKGEN